MPNCSKCPFTKLCDEDTDIVELECPYEEIESLEKIINDAKEIIKELSNKKSLTTDGRNLTCDICCNRVWGKDFQEGHDKTCPHQKAINFMEDNY
jgi:hypothetical protein